MECIPVCPQFQALAASEDLEAKDPGLLFIPMDGDTSPFLQCDPAGIVICQQDCWSPENFDINGRCGRDYQVVEWLSGIVECQTNPDPE
jgi:hypothetical protein